MDRKINWFIPPIILVVIIVIVNIAYYKKRKVFPKKIVIKQQETEMKPLESVIKTSVKADNIKDKEDIVLSGSHLLKQNLNKSFAIQVASFRKRKRASSFVNSLRKNNYNAYIVAKDIPGKGTWYRVRIGNFSTKNEAKGVLGEIKTKYLQSFITLYVNPDINLGKTKPAGK